MTDAAAYAEPSRSKWWRYAAVAGVIVLVGWLTVRGLSRAEPAYWQPLDDDAESVQQTAALFEQYLLSQLSRVRQSEQAWSLDITQHQINAWLASRLPLWLLNRGVDSRIVNALRHVMIDTTDSRIELAVQSGAIDGAPIVRLRYRPVPASDDAAARLQLRGIWLGRLPLPKHYVLARFFERVDETLEEEKHPHLRDMLTSLPSLPLRMPLHDGRTVHIDHVMLGEGRLRLICRTEFKP